MFQVVRKNRDGKPLSYNKNGEESGELTGTVLEALKCFQIGSALPKENLLSPGPL